MAGPAVRRDPHGEPPLVAGDRLQQARFADEADVRLPAAFGDVLDEPARPVAADLFVIADEEMHRAGEAGGLQIGNRCQAGGDEALLSAVPRP